MTLPQTLTAQLQTIQVTVALTCKHIGMCMSVYNTHVFNVFKNEY